MKIEWNETKRLKNLAKHKLDFRDVRHVLIKEHVVVPSIQDHGEARLLATAPWKGEYLTVVYTMRRDTYRIISFRRARDEEEIRYQDLYA